MGKKKEAVEIYVIADRSGSMASIRDDAIGGFNTFLAEQKAEKGASNLTLVLFDDKYEVPVDQVDIQKVEPLTTQTFVPRGMTAMNDAIGKALATLEEKAPKRAIVCILTDGEENCSREYTAAQVKEKVKAAEARGWQVVFLAANIDAFQAGGSYGISRKNTAGFQANAAGVGGAFMSMSAATRLYRNT